MNRSPEAPNPWIRDRQRWKLLPGYPGCHRSALNLQTQYWKCGAAVDDVAPATRVTTARGTNPTGLRGKALVAAEVVPRFPEQQPELHHDEPPTRATPTTATVS